MGRSYRVVVAGVVVPARARALERTLESADGSTVLLHGVLCAVWPDLPAPAGDLLLVHAPPVPVHDLGVAYAHARRALDLLRERGVTGLHFLLDHALALTLAQETWLGTALARAQLGALDRGDQRQVVLVETVLAHLITGMRIDLTAERLHVHPNTVKYRLRRFEQLLPGVLAGREADVPARTTLWWALTAWLAAVPDKPGA